jgi:tetraacyldisaccharide 4'-kinase
VERRLTELWYAERGRLSLLQAPALVYRVVSALRRHAYAVGWLRSGRVGRPVVVVGNLTVGGTGKTPLTIWLAQALSAQGLAVGIVSRGYGGRQRRAHRVRADDDWRHVGDEALLLARHSGCRTVVGADRLAAARLLGAGVDVVLADDGLQHLRLARDCEIVVVDGARGFGNGRLLPAGPLREGVTHLARADAIVVNGPATHPSLRQLPPQVPCFNMALALGAVMRLDGTESLPIEAWRGRRVHAVAGIGNPGRFFAALEACGLEPIPHPFPDHHPFSSGDFAFADELPVLMTEKDAVKCARFINPRLWYVPVSAQFEPTAARALLARVLGRVRGRGAGGGSP